MDFIKFDTGTVKGLISIDDISGIYKEEGVLYIHLKNGNGYYSIPDASFEDCVKQLIVAGAKIIKG